MLPIARPNKLTHAETMLYEFDMLRFTVQRLAEKRWSAEMDEWACLESFLVHFRNLIEFFGHPKPRPDDLHINKPDTFWPDVAKRPKQEVLSKLFKPALWDEYEDEKPDKISKYLHHCTKIRIETKEWEVGKMYDQIRPLLEEFESLLPDKSRSWRVPVSAEIPTSHTASTASGHQPVFSVGPSFQKPQKKES